MAENALDLATTAAISLGSPSGLDDLASPFTLFLLYRNDVAIPPNAGMVSKISGAGVGWYFNKSGTTDVGFGRDLTTTDPFYFSNTCANATATWYWLAMAYDQSLGTNLKARFYQKVWSAGSFTDLGSNGSVEGSGTIVTDAAQTLLIGYEASYFGLAAEWDVAAYGMMTGAKTAAECQTIVDDIQGQSWLGLWGKPTANNGFPLLLGSAAGIAAGTVSGTVALETDAPDWYTGGAVGTLNDDDGFQLMPIWPQQMEVSIW